MASYKPDLFEVSLPGFWLGSATNNLFSTVSFDHFMKEFIHAVAVTRYAVIVGWCARKSMQDFIG